MKFRSAIFAAAALLLGITMAPGAIAADVTDVGYVDQSELASLPVFINANSALAGDKARFDAQFNGQVKRARSDAQRQQMRQDLAVPILEKFHAWLETERAAVADLVVTDLRRDGAQHAALGAEQVARLEVAVAGEGADGDVVAVVAEVGELRDPGRVDEHRGRRQPQLHEREQRHAAGEDLRLVAVLRQRADDLVGRAGPDVVERGGNHFVPPTRAAARTDCTMLW